MSDLPPLPEPDFMSGDMTCGETAFTAEQMRTYAREAIARVEHLCPTCRCDRRIFGCFCSEKFKTQEQERPS